MNYADQTKNNKAISELIKVVSQLREPNGGCPWDLAQTHASLIPYVLEEAHEVVDAIRHGDDESLIEELGDLLLQVILHCQIGLEEERFSLYEITKAITNKLIRRHPHVFGNVKYTLSEVELKKQWEEIKILEKPKTTSKSPLSERLKKKIRSQTALSGAMTISKETAQLGFEWKTIDGAWEKVDEKLEELKEALINEELDSAQEELGDLIFTLINIARWCNLSPEEGLSGTNHRFLNRFKYVEESFQGELSNYSFKEIRMQWVKAKHALLNQRGK